MSDARRSARMTLLFISILDSVIAWDNWTKQKNAMSPGAKIAQMYKNVCMGVLVG